MLVKKQSQGSYWSLVWKRAPGTLPITYNMGVSVDLPDSISVQLPATISEELPDTISVDLPATNLFK